MHARTELHVALSVLTLHPPTPPPPVSPACDPPENVTTACVQKEADKWVYPSEQQYYNAIKRKGYKASATDMPSTLAIHNAVNEKGWQMVQEWERVRAEAASGGGGGGAAAAGEGSAGVPTPKLLRFTGRPQDTSPKAWVKSTLLGYRPPFDR